MLLTGCSIDISNSSFCNGPQLDVPCGERSSPDSGDCARLGGAAFRRSRTRPDLSELEQFKAESFDLGEDAEQRGRSALKCSVRPDHRDPAMPPHLPDGKTG